MPSRLSSLLVRDGLVGVKRMEKAFQRQVIYGGCLDTILLEMNLVPEERLTQYLALASGLPPAARDEAEKIDGGAVSIVSREIAEQYRAVPVALEGEAVRMLVCAPLELTELENLADLIDRPLQPLITPEYRWHLVFAAAYGLDPPARFTTLARSLDVDTASTPVGRGKAVIVDEAAPKNAVPIGTVDTQPTPAPTRVDDFTSEDDTQKTVVPVEEIRLRNPTLIGIEPSRATKRSSEPPRTRRDGVPEEPVPRPMVTFHTPSSGGAAGNSPSTGIPKAVLPDSGPKKRPGGPRPLRRPPTTPIPTEGRDTPLPISRAREMLAIADDRDTVFLTLLRAARSRARWAGLLTVQGGAAIGRVGIAEVGLDVSAVHTVLIPLDAVSPFRTVVSNHQPHIGPLASGDTSVDAMMLRFGGTMPPSALLLPIVLRDRVVALVVAHRVTSDIRLADVTELLPIATAASDALGRLIVKHKSAGYRAPMPPDAVPIVAEQIETKKHAKPAAMDGREGSANHWVAPAETNVAVGEISPARPSIPAFEPIPSEPQIEIETEPPRPIDHVLDDLEKAREGHAEDLITEGVERANESLGALMRRFPGTLRVERFGVTGRPLRAAQYGGLLELVIQLGSIASELLIEKMSAPQRDVRFYATVCCMELRPRNAVFALVERLFDQDYGVRACAIEALAGYPVSDLNHALARARRAVHSSDPEVVGAAAAAIVELGDVEAIADLIGVIERNDRAGDHARKALMALTAQDFGPSEKRWRKWHETARTRHRVEWLIDGLAHKEDTVREGAINVLRRLTGEYFGYHHDLPRKERDLAAERWVAWWKETGQRRFVIKEDERMRPTALMPSRRDP
jgi:hypothetical protein